jgi:hypothetical protein
MTKNEAREYLTAQIARGSNTAPGTGWRQMRRDIGQMRGDLCRSDAVGRLSKSDIAVLDAVIEEYRASGKIGPEWNGYLTIK